MKLKLIFSLLMTSLILLNTACHRPAIKADNQSEACQLKPETGPCKAAIPKYYFDQNIQSCATFNWGGCKGVVPFDTLESCEAACVMKKRWYDIFKKKANEPSFIDSL